MELSNQPIKGAQDWLPEEMKVRRLIFDTWRRVCRSFGYEEYLTPLLESADIYRAKSGEDVGQKELMVITDRGGRELSIRPEMTPSVARLVSRIYQSRPKPIRFFSIANFIRNEKPQRGRNREFWQLNCDIFGSTELTAEVETIQLAIELMLAFGAPAESFTVKINNRRMLDDFVRQYLNLDPAKKPELLRLLDKSEKLGLDDFKSSLKELGLADGDMETIIDFLKVSDLDNVVSKYEKLAGSPGFNDLRQVLDNLIELGYGRWVKFGPDVIRGLDYYDGIVFELFDNYPENNRALFGGGRYNSLAGIFGKGDIPAVGFAPGDETMKLFLKSWSLIDKLSAQDETEIYYLPVLNEVLQYETQKLAQSLRGRGYLVELGLSVEKVGKALEYANKRNFDKVIILGVEEKDKGIYKIKNMQTGEESEASLK